MSGPVQRCHYCQRVLLTPWRVLREGRVVLVCGDCLTKEGDDVTTLSEWLLAQIAADEAPTYVLEPYSCEPDCCAPAGWVGHRCLICGTPTEYGGTVAAIEETAREHEERVHQRSRVLAECEAKRLLLEWASHDDWTDPRYTGLAIAPGSDRGDVLSWLALPYADRPGYREEWRP